MILECETVEFILLLDLHLYILNVSNMYIIKFGYFNLNITKYLNYRSKFEVSMIFCQINEYLYPARVH